MLDHRRPPIWYAVAALSTLTAAQWQAFVKDMAGAAVDRVLLRTLFERADRSDADRQWLLDQVGLALWLDEVLACPAATAEHVRSVLRRREAASTVAEGLSRRHRLHERPDLVALAVEATNCLDHLDALTLARRWPDGQPVPRELLYAILDRAVHVPPQPRGYRAKPVTSPVSGYWSALWTLLRNVSSPMLCDAARRSPRVQAVLLEYGENLDEAMVAACVPVCADPNLGGVEDLALAGRLATLRRWAQRYPALADQAQPAWAAAARDAVAALGRDEEWGLVDEIVAFTTDPGILADTVDRVATTIRIKIGLRDPGEADSSLELEGTLRQARQALLTLAACPHTPDEALVAALPLAPAYTTDELAKLRPELAEPCAAEQLARTDVWKQPQIVEPLVEVADDAALAATGDPAAALTGYLAYLPQGDRAQCARLAVSLLRSRYADATVLAALPAAIVINSPWHATLAASMLADACGDDPQRWSVVGDRIGYNMHPLTFAGFLAELREYQPPRTVGRGLAGYRYCHACRLVTPQTWNTPDKQQPMPRHTDWMVCRLCSHLAPPVPVMDTDASLTCPRCGHRIDHPAAAAVLACPHCEQMFFHPDLPADLRPRVEAVLAERERVAGVVRDLSKRISQLLSPGNGDADSGPEHAGPGGPPAQRSRPAPQPLTPLPDGWTTDTEPVFQQFRAALATAIRRSDSRTRANAALLRYGLGRTRRPLTNPEVAQRLGISVSRAQEAIRACANAIYLSATAPLPASPTAHQRASLITAHLARQALGDLDRTPAAADRIRAFIDAALPDVDAPTSTRLLLRLAGQDWQLTRQEIQQLIWMVKAGKPNFRSAQHER